MNIAVINIKDVFKYILKISIIVFLIYMCVQIINSFRSSMISSKQEKIKEGIEREVDKINNYTFLDCIDISLSLFSYKKTDESKATLTKPNILSMETGIFNKAIFENTDLVIDENELTIDDTEELEKQIEELPKDVTIEEVEENNIKAKYTTSYKDVKINNQSKYDITEDMLVPDAEIKNKKDILIYHTHTCESYTPSERI